MKVAGRWTSSTGVVDQHGQVIDVLLPARHDLSRRPVGGDLAGGREDALPRGADPARVVAAPRCRQEREDRAEVLPPVAWRHRNRADRVLVAAQRARLVEQGATDTYSTVIN